MATTWTDFGKLYTIPMMFVQKIRDPNHKHMLWHFGTDTKQFAIILISTGNWNKKVCIKTIIPHSNFGDLITYKVDKKTFEKWKIWHGIKAESIFDDQTNHIAPGKFDLYCFETEFFTELSNLDT